MGSTAPEPPPLPLLAGEREEAERLARRFLDSELAGRARAAPEILIEEPLTLPFIDGRLLDGVLDLAFLEPSGWVLVDYKSDRVAAEDVPARAARYRLQLALYAHAIARLTGRPVAEAQIFFLDSGASQRYGADELEPLAEAVGATGAGVTSAAPTISSAGSSAT
jgi:ATP-dependent exoDNAse (exonuclease V) beta subunit